MCDLFVTFRIHIKNRLPMFHQHVFVILLWGILMSPLSLSYLSITKRLGLYVLRFFGGYFLQLYLRSSVSIPCEGYNVKNCPCQTNKVSQSEETMPWIPVNKWPHGACREGKIKPAGHLWSSSLHSHVSEFSLPPNLYSKVIAH